MQEYQHAHAHTTSRKHNHTWTHIVVGDKFVDASRPSVAAGPASAAPSDCKAAEASPDPDQADSFTLCRHLIPWLWPKQQLHKEPVNMSVSVFRIPPFFGLKRRNSTNKSRQSFGYYETDPFGYPQTESTSSAVIPSGSEAPTISERAMHLGDFLPRPAERAERESLR